MSHFAVLVVLPEEPTHEALDRALAPWHEFECTGRNDEHVIQIDVTEEAFGEYDRWTTTRLRDGDGNLDDPYDDEGELKAEFSRDSKLFVPEGYEEVRVPAREVEDRATWIADYYGTHIARGEDSIDITGEHKFGHVLVDEAGEVIRVVKRTNPNKKWDYWTVGGRYSGRLAPGYDPEKDPANLEACLCAEQGRSASDCYRCNGTGTRAKWPSRWVDVGNRSRWGDLDLGKLKEARVAERSAMVEEMRLKAGLSAEEFETGFKAQKAAHGVWLGLEEPRPRGSEYTAWLRTQPDGDLAAAYRKGDTWNDIEASEGQSISEWIDAAPAISAYAVVVDGKWCSRGEMGWFGISHGDSDDWSAQMQAIIEAIPADHHVAFVDCHI